MVTVLTLELDPIFNRLAEHIHHAAKQFDAVNHDHEYANVVVFTNSDAHCGFPDLLAVLTETSILKVVRRSRSSQTNNRPYEHLESFSALNVFSFVPRQQHSEWKIR
jgi:hypothetical protein